MTLSLSKPRYQALKPQLFSGSYDQLMTDIHDKAVMGITQGLWSVKVKQPKQYNNNLSLPAILLKTPVACGLQGRADQEMRSRGEERRGEEEER